jgi:hypothetical protein
VTAAWLTLNVAEDLPAAIVTVAGAFAAAGSELIKATMSPPAGAGPVSVTVPVTAVVEPPLTEVGETVNDASAAG